MTRHGDRCGWADTDELYRRYHDEEWGVPVRDDAGQFEFIILEGAQAGLSWLTILRRRDAYRLAFRNFDAEKVAVMTDAELEALLTTDSGIIRNRLKVYAARANARIFLSIQKEFGSFSSYIWSFTQGKPKINAPETLDEIPAVTKESMDLAADLKRRGMKFFGPTIAYAHMQATGLVQDHVTNCFRYKAIL